MKAAPLLLALLTVTSAGTKENTPPALPAEKPLVLEPFKVKGEAIGSFAIDIVIYANPHTKKVTRLFIAAVLPESDAAELGLQRGDEILKINGVPVKDMEAPPIAKDTQLGRIFLNRRAGDKLDLEVISQRPQKFTLRAGADLPGRRRDPSTR